MDAFHHERLYRGMVLMNQLHDFGTIVICGAGALGSNLIENLSRIGAKNLAIIDDDRVEEHNLSTQIYERNDIGSKKASQIEFHTYRKTGIRIDSFHKRLTTKTISGLLKGAALVVDCFDNSESRSLVKEFCMERGIPCLHIGLSADYGEVIWGEQYTVPPDGGVDDCNYPLARNLVLLSVVAGTESILEYLKSGKMINWTITLKDLQIRQATF